MALVHCSECGSEVSSFALNCPYCGFPVAGGFWAGLPAEVLLTSGGTGLLWLLNVGTPIVLLMAGLFGMLAVFLVVVRVRCNGWSVFGALVFAVFLGLVGFGLGYGLGWAMQNGLPFPLPTRTAP